MPRVAGGDFDPCDSRELRNVPSRAPAIPARDSCDCIVVVAVRLPFPVGGAFANIVGDGAAFVGACNSGKFGWLQRRDRLILVGSARVRDVVADSDIRRSGEIAASWDAAMEEIVVFVPVGVRKPPPWLVACTRASVRICASPDNLRVAPKRH